MVSHSKVPALFKQTLFSQKLKGNVQALRNVKWYIIYKVYIRYISLYKKKLFNKKENENDQWSNDKNEFNVDNSLIWVLWFLLEKLFWCFRL